MIETSPIPMPGRLQRLAAFGGFLAYLLTQAQVDAHRKQRAQLLEAVPMPGPTVETGGHPVQLHDWDHGSTDDDDERLHDQTPHIHWLIAGADVWPHRHDG